MYYYNSNNQQNLGIEGFVILVENIILFYSGQF